MYYHNTTSNASSYDKEAAFEPTPATRRPHSTSYSAAGAAQQGGARQPTRKSTRRQVPVLPVLSPSSQNAIDRIDGDGLDDEVQIISSTEQPTTAFESQR